MKRQHWQPLQPGDQVDIVAPGMKTTAKILKQAAQFLRSWDLVPRYPKDIFSREAFCAQSKEKRFGFLKHALTTKDSQAVWCIRGGYGSFQLLADLKKVKTAHCKIFLGLSDITSLHTFLHQEWGWSVLHGSNIDRYAEDKVSSKESKELRKVLFGETEELKYHLKPLNSLASQKRSIKAPVLGGNMITLQASFGTDFQIQTRGKILFFEDIGERGYRVHRVLEHMQQLGLFRQVKAVVFGQFTGGREPNGPSLVPKVLKEFAQEMKFPVFSGLESGHGTPQRPLPMGPISHLHCGRSPQLVSPTGRQL